MTEEVSFEITHTCPFPETTNGANTALTICTLDRDPALAFLTQTPGVDEFVMLRYNSCDEYFRYNTPPDRLNTGGMHSDETGKYIYCCQATTSSPTVDDRDIVYIVEAISGAERGALTIIRDNILFHPSGLAIHDGMIVISSQPIPLPTGGAPIGHSAIGFYSTGGQHRGTQLLEDQSLSGLSTTPWGLLVTDRANNLIKILDKRLGDVAVCPGVGADHGMQAIAFDHIQFDRMDDHPQRWLPNGVFGPPGSPEHPDTPWDPKPYKQSRHRIYVANDADQTIYIGYFTHR